MLAFALTLGKSNIDIDYWIESIPKGLRAIRIKDRMEAVLKGEPASPIDRPVDSQPNRYRYPLTVTVQQHPALFRYIDFLQKNNYQVATHLAWLIRGTVLPQEYLTYTSESTSTSEWQTTPVQMTTSVRPEQPVQAIEQTGDTQQPPQPVEQAHNGVQTAVETKPVAQNSQSDAPVHGANTVIEESASHDSHSPSPSANEDVETGTEGGTGVAPTGQTRINPVALQALKRASQNQ